MCYVCNNTKYMDKLKEFVDSNRSAFDSEIWGDAEQMMAAFRRPVYSTLVFRLNQRDALAKVKDTIAADPRLQHERHHHRHKQQHRVENQAHDRA